MNLKFLVEGVIFASGHPTSIKALSQLLERPEAEIEECLQQIMASYESDDHGMALVKVAGGYQFRTKEALKEIMAKLYEKRPPRLTQATLEVLAIVAYKQPVTRPEIEKIRGVDCTAVLQTLLERELVEMKGRSPLPGNPVIYATSQKFLEWFQISRIEDLPPLTEIAALRKSFGEGADNLLEVLNRDEGFVQESLESMDETLRQATNDNRHLEEQLNPTPQAAEGSSEINKAPDSTL